MEAQAEYSSGYEPTTPQTVFRAALEIRDLGLCLERSDSAIYTRSTFNSVEVYRDTPDVRLNPLTRHDRITVDVMPSGSVIMSRIQTRKSGSSKARYTELRPDGTAKYLDMTALHAEQLPVHYYNQHPERIQQLLSEDGYALNEAECNEWDGVLKSILSGAPLRERRERASTGSRISQLLSRTRKDT
jgi:hypothetical protein